MATLAFTDSSFEEQVLKSDKPVLVDFWAEWCQPCHMVAPIIDELAAEYDGKVVFGKMNVDENANVPGTFGIMSLPTVVLFKNGKPERTMVGVQGKDSFKKNIDEVLGL